MKSSQNLVDTRLTNTEVLRSAMLLLAWLHKFPTHGKIAAGMRADLIVPSPGADPLEDITATKNISRI
jgi:hypothetical protein